MLGKEMVSSGWDRKVHESEENEIDGILDFARSIGGEMYDDMAIEDMQHLLVEQEFGKANVVEIASQPQVNEISYSSDEDNEVNNF